MITVIARIDHQNKGCFNVKEIREIIAAYDQAAREGKKTALATLVHVEGSSYRRPGARMLITDDGRLTGAISGGCLEGDALRKALFVMARQKPVIVTYDTMDDEESAFGVGLGCNGVVHVLIEPVDSADPVNAIELLRLTTKKRSTSLVATLYCLRDKNADAQGTCLFMDSNDVMVPAAVQLFFGEQLMADARMALSSGQSAFRQFISENAEMNAFIEVIKPAIRLVIFGAGNDVKSLADMAMVLGWETIIADSQRRASAGTGFNPSCRVIQDKPEEVLRQLDLDNETAVLLMTHNYHYDLAVLEALSGRNIRYIGSLGPRKKTDKMLAELSARGVSFDHERAALHGPAGLDIGAETPEEIALSILSEIRASFSDKNGSSLREVAGAIHPRPGIQIGEVKVGHAHDKK
ncbi:MAG TPA: XdhC/CoxI family protein, partial [Puia sp.]|nr:XdhC/CoxI family protein [Puia sp.]